MPPNGRQFLLRDHTAGGLAKCVLIVDDEPSVRSVIRRLLQHYGITVIDAATGTEAIEIFRARNAEIDLVLLDVRMEPLDGPATLHFLQSIDPQVRCCFLTGDPGDYTEEELLGLGAMRVLRKPFILAAVLEIVSDTRPPVLSGLNANDSPTG